MHSPHFPQESQVLSPFSHVPASQNSVSPGVHSEGTMQLPQIPWAHVRVPGQLNSPVQEVFSPLTHSASPLLKGIIVGANSGVWGMLLAPKKSPAIISPIIIKVANIIQLVLSKNPHL